MTSPARDSPLLRADEFRRRRRRRRRRRGAIAGSGGGGIIARQLNPAVQASIKAESNIVVDIFSVVAVQGLDYAWYFSSGLLRQFIAKSEGG